MPKLRRVEALEKGEALLGCQDEAVNNIGMPTTVLWCFGAQFIEVITRKQCRRL